MGFPELFVSFFGMCTFSIPPMCFWVALSFFFVINTYCFLRIKKCIYIYIYIYNLAISSGCETDFLGNLGLRYI